MVGVGLGAGGWGLGLGESADWIYAKSPLPRTSASEECQVQEGYFRITRLNLACAHSGCTHISVPDTYATQRSDPSKLKQIILFPVRGTRNRMHFPGKLIF